MKELVLASRNRKKAAELQALLDGLGWQVRPVADFPEAPEAEETGATFQENAILKAEAVAKALGKAALADDSGLAVDALHGEPGVRSARYAGPGADDAANNALLLRKLADIEPEARTARFHCCLAFAAPGRQTITFAGSCEGRILEAPRGSAGFGYDPLFLSDELGCTFAEAAEEAKGAVSHRGRALARFREWIAGDGEACGA